MFSSRRGKIICCEADSPSFSHFFLVTCQTRDPSHTINYCRYNHTVGRVWRYQRGIQNS